MVDQCCVDGCFSNKEELYYFKLPVSRTLRKRWLDAINSTLKLTDDAVVCSRHFLEEQYIFVRGKRRLKPKVVPSIFEKKEDKSNSHENEELITRNAESGSGASNDGDKTEKEDSVDKEDDKDANEERSVPEGSCRNSPNRAKEKAPDLEFSPNKDIEDIITNYQIQTRPLSETSAEKAPAACASETAIPESLPCERDANSEQPKYIEISVGGKSQDQTNEDCLMLLENVQVEVDPNLFSDLDHDDRDHEQTIEEVDLDQDSSSDCIDLGEKKEAPISLLSSSDEDDVIIQEPKIDTIEVSDVTDEDDIPLLKLVKRHKTRPKRSSKSEKNTAINKIMLHKYKCQHCNYSARDAADYGVHMSRHTHVLHVCDVCAYTTSSWLLLHRHKDKHSRESKDSRRRNREKKFRCPLCSYRAKHNMSLVYHMSTHGTEHAFECEGCGFFTDARDAVVKHLKECRGAKLSCGHCEYRAGNKSSLRRHLKKRHQDENADDGDYVPPACV